MSTKSCSAFKLLIIQRHYPETITDAFLRAIPERIAHVANARRLAPAARDSWVVNLGLTGKSGLGMATNSITKTRNGEIPNGTRGRVVRWARPCCYRFVHINILIPSMCDSSSRGSRRRPCFGGRGEATAICGRKTVRLVAKGRISFCPIEGVPASLGPRLRTVSGAVRSLAILQKGIDRCPPQSVGAPAALHWVDTSARFR
jgi:hypothetical protein